MAKREPPWTEARRRAEDDAHRVVPEHFGRLRQAVEIALRDALYWRDEQWRKHVAALLAKQRGLSADQWFGAGPSKENEP